jgi:transposase
MIVGGLDVHKHSLTAVAVDEIGRPLGEWSGPAADQLAAWAQGLAAERLWALEDCRHVTRRLEQALLEAGERLVRVPPRLTAPERRRGRPSRDPPRRGSARRGMGAGVCRDAVSRGPRKRATTASLMGQ